MLTAAFSQGLEGFVSLRLSFHDASHPKESDLRRASVMSLLFQE